MWWIIFGSIAVIYLAGISSMAWLSLHPPRIPLFCSPGAFGVPQEDVVLHPRPGVVLSAWWCPAHESRGIAVLCHGYVMNRSELAPIAVQLWREGVSCLLFDFRAHGGSRGGICTVGARETEDVDAALEFVKAANRGLPIMLLGSSMGAVAAARSQGARSKEVKLIVLDSGYSRLDQAVPGWWRFVGGRPLQILLAPVLSIAAIFARIRPKTIDVAQALRENPGPNILILHGRSDDLASPAQALRNLDAAGSRARIEWFEGCGHSEGRWRYPDQYWGALRQSMEDAFQLPERDRPNDSRRSIESDRQ